MHSNVGASLLAIGAHELSGKTQILAFHPIVIFQP
jgi:hypothetical protein